MANLGRAFLELVVSLPQRAVFLRATSLLFAALASGMVSPVALAAPGDLDPGFADVGRFVLPDFLGPALFVAAQDDRIIVAGGHLYSGLDARGFANRLSSTGTLDATFASPGLNGVMVVDAKLQSDGKIVGAGNRNFGTSIEHVVFRLERDGALDTGFGVNGVRKLPKVTGVGSVAVDPSGTIVIAVWLGNDLKVLRLLSTGEPDNSFGIAGVFTAAGALPEFVTPPRILSAENGGYRITVNFNGDCRLLALTASGSVDDTFGDQGYAGVGAPGKFVQCHSMAELPDGRLLVAGVLGSRPLVVRLLASGAVDPNFAAEPLADTTLYEATDIAVDPNNGSIVVVVVPNTFQVLFDFYEPELVKAGVAVARLQTDGALDTLFGDEGVTWVDPPKHVDSNGNIALPGDVTVLPNSDVLVSGGIWSLNQTSFVARLVGGRGNDGPGVLGVKNYFVLATEDAHQAIVSVRRMGGKVGSVSVAYEAHATSSDVYHATEGQDFTVAPGRLEWADGDASEKQIVVSIAPDDGSPEENERFVVQLSDVQGGAGLGTPDTGVTITSNAPAAGMFGIESVGSASESGPGAQVRISRGYHFEGRVSVTVTMSSGTATSGEDFTAVPLTVSWADGHGGVKLVEIPIIDDSRHEPQEQFSLRLSDATGGAIIGPRATASVSIADNDAAALPTITVAAPDLNASEQGLDSGTFTISRTGSTTANLTVFHSIGGTANPATSVDYNGQPGGSTLIPAGASTAYITITPVDDATVEDPETVTLTITANAAYVHATPPQNTASITIADNDTDNDTFATVSVAATDTNASEQGLGTGTFTITRTGSSLAAPLTVLHSIGGTANPATSVDYNGQPGDSTLIPAGASTATITITSVDDATVEDPETVTLTITANAAYVIATPPQNTASITIADNDAPSSGGGGSGGPPDGGGGRTGFVSFLLLGVARLLRAAGSRKTQMKVFPARSSWPRMKAAALTRAERRVARGPATTRPGNAAPGSSCGPTAGR